MTNQTALLTPVRADHSVDAVRLRYIAGQAENFTTALDELRDHLVAVTRPEGRHIVAIIEQAAAAAHDLGIAAAIVADTLTGGVSPAQPMSA